MSTKVRATCATSRVRNQTCTTVCTPSCWRRSPATARSMRTCCATCCGGSSRRPAFECLKGARPMPRPLLVVPLDGSELAERALPYAVRLAAARGGQLALVRVALGPPPSGFDWEDQQVAAVDEAEAYLSRVADTLAVDRLPIQTIAPYGHAAAQIAKLSEELGATAVVMATHGRTGLPHLLYGSVAEAVLARSRIPVFLVPARPGESAMAPFDPISPRIVVALDGSAFAEAALPAARE